jgi:hypothetical protein
MTMIKISSQLSALQQAGVLDSEAPHNFMSDKDKLILAEAALDGTLYEHHIYCDAHFSITLTTENLLEGQVASVVGNRFIRKVWWQPKRKEGIFS